MMPKIGTFDGEQAIAQMDGALLENMISRLLARPMKVTDWQVTLLGGLDSSPMEGGVYKVMGTAVTPTNESHKLCLVVKILRSPEGFPMPDGNVVTREMAEDRNNFGYWQREALAAQADLFDSLPAGLGVPRFLGISHNNEGECWLWQECLPEDSAWTWECKAGKPLEDILAHRAGLVRFYLSRLSGS